MGSILLDVSPAVASVIAIACFVVGVGLGGFLLSLYIKNKMKKNKSNAIKIIEDAYAEAKTIKKEALIESKENAQKLKDEVEKAPDILRYY